jgi:hypothetical protein
MKTTASFDVLLETYLLDEWQAVMAWKSESLKKFLVSDFRMAFSRSTTPSVRSL